VCEHPPWHCHQQLITLCQSPPDLGNIPQHHRVCIQVDGLGELGEQRVKLEASEVGWAGKVPNILWTGVHPHQPLQSSSSTLHHLQLRDWAGTLLQGVAVV